MKILSSIGAVNISFCLVLLVGCGSTGVKDDAAGGEDAPKLMDTVQYMPSQEYDEKTSAYLPYVAQENPYVAQKGRIKKDAVTKYIQARRLYKAKNYKQAHVVLDEIIAIDKSLSGPWVMKGDIAVDQDLNDEAIKHYQKAVSVNPKNINAYLRMAKSQRVLGRFLKAQNTYAEVLGVWPDFPEAHLNIGVLYDIYLNHPLRAQKHMQAYLFLSGGKDKQVLAWVDEIQNRTGVKTSLISERNVQTADSLSKVN